LIYFVQLRIAPSIFSENFSRSKQESSQFWTEILQLLRLN